MGKEEELFATISRVQGVLIRARDHHENLYMRSADIDILGVLLQEALAITFEQVKPASASPYEGVARPCHGTQACPGFQERADRARNGLRQWCSHLSGPLSEQPECNRLDYCKNLAEWRRKCNYSRDASSCPEWKKELISSLDTVEDALGTKSTETLNVGGEDTISEAISEIARRGLTVEAQEVSSFGTKFVLSRREAQREESLTSVIAVGDLWTLNSCSTTYLKILAVDQIMVDVVWMDEVNTTCNRIGINFLLKHCTRVKGTIHRKENSDSDCCEEKADSDSLECGRRKMAHTYEECVGAILDELDIDLSRTRVDTPNAAMCAILEAISGGDPAPDMRHDAAVCLFRRVLDYHATPTDRPSVYEADFAKICEGINAWLNKSEDGDA
jgi:hypothetical protein